MKKELPIDLFKKIGLGDQANIIMPKLYNNNIVTVLSEFKQVQNYEVANTLMAREKQNERKKH